MSIIVARKGRQRQRYEDNFRLVSGCIPYRLVRNNDEESFDLENSLEVLMISSPNRDDLVFPKGGWEDDETVEEAACREALEEAGVKGIIIVFVCAKCVYEIDKDKSSFLVCPT